MEESLRQVVVFLFKSRGWNAIRERDLAFEMSMRRKWFSHTDSNRAVAMMRSLGLIVSEGEDVRPAFEMPEGDLPADWKPDTARIFGEGGGETKAQAPRFPASGGLPDASPQTHAVSQSVPAPKADGIISDAFSLEEAASLWQMDADALRRSAQSWKDTLGVGDGGALLLAGYENGKDPSPVAHLARKRDSAKGG